MSPRHPASPPTSPLHLLAWINLVLGGLWVLGGGIAMVTFLTQFRSASADLNPLLIGTLVIQTLLIGIVVAMTAIDFLRRPNREDALNLARNAAVILFMLLNAAMPSSLSTGVGILPLGIVALVIVYFIHRLALKPMVQKHFSAPEGLDPMETGTSVR